VQPSMDAARQTMSAACIMACVAAVPLEKSAPVPPSAPATKSLAAAFVVGHQNSAELMLLVRRCAIIKCLPPLHHLLLHCLLVL